MKGEREGGGKDGCYFLVLGEQVLIADDDGVGTIEKRGGREGG